MVGRVDVTLSKKKNHCRNEGPDQTMGNGTILLMRVQLVNGACCVMCKWIEMCDWRVRSSCLIE